MVKDLVPTFSERVTVTLRHSSMRVLRREASMVEWAVIWDRLPHAHTRGRVFSGNDGLHSCAVLRGMV